jgi:hypothetical protein
MAQQPAFDRRGLMGAVVIDNQMELNCTRHCRINGFQEATKLNRAMASIKLANYSAGIFPLTLRPTLPFGVRCRTDDGRTEIDQFAPLRTTSPLGRGRLHCPRREIANTLDMIAEHQLLRMRVEIDLSLQIGNIELSRVVPKESDRHDQRHEATAVVID